jgi:hypothetical protein
MMPLAEESRHNSATPLPGSSEAQDTVSDNGLESSERPPITQPGRLRRTSQAALNRFSRNRASTVTGVPPTLNNTTNNQDARTNEYGSHVVDVLDVIGKLSELI